MEALIVLALVSFVLHLVWERSHIHLYAGYDALKGRLPVFVWASMGDVMYTFFAISLVGIFKGDILWFLYAGSFDYVGLAITGLFLAISVEYKAAALKRWEYTSKMPRLFSLGLTPLIQMTVLLPLSVYITVAISRLGS